MNLNKVFVTDPFDQREGAPSRFAQGFELPGQDVIFGGLSGHVRIANRKKREPSRSSA
jgi:hypothetical protein